jgi:hypothetical protein
VGARLGSNQKGFIASNYRHLTYSSSSTSSCVSSRFQRGKWEILTSCYWIKVSNMSCRYVSLCSHFYMHSLGHWTCNEEMKTDIFLGSAPLCGIKIVFPIHSLVRFYRHAAFRYIHPPFSKSLNPGFNGKSHPVTKLAYLFFVSFKPFWIPLYTYSAMKAMPAMVPIVW